ncbi:MAG: D-glycero-beta-D-manno-heptose 1,7-bisphosphate 7-phosphatase [Endomicrobiia bacterium]|jgi:histidinol-phosphate phosphatase family protein|nr:D-glycero-beta-D-manno-heptose 1,7-bisphosphate 7-phosphatase [Endomicrobiaceae bacterium]MDD3053863.1 D-glycero-beta-D-manno-heptose 1,7-bisphosphate 7-phosphatase [Endomicrobiaceae bacterium]MDD3923067.1 D-glycero-beta-D-manno-heptose 1,7-bisphosphate 7-phosphatase [Endomicrobiaceae bacterium]MDD5102744.1 D-glycero-beta-D-manno-heptose 1,7-bisphosphate 7-phosphatase [Endomicrobiaceae bacterium]
MKNKKENLYPAVFLDRDGTINHDKHYLSDEKDLKIYSFVKKSILKLQKAGFKIVIVTNQSGISRGFFSENKLKKIHNKLIALLKEQNIKIDGIYYCPHGPNDICDCRKPKIGMATKAADDLNIDLKKSYTVGDSTRDYLLGYNFGGKGILVLTGHGKKQVNKIAKEKQKPLAVVKNLYLATEVIINDHKKV